MGCDIHCYIEYKAKGRDQWSDFGGRINPGRNYSLFGAMAGVRTEHIPFITPRGCPEDCASAAFGDNTHYISEDQKPDTYELGGDLYYSKAHAAESVRKGYCQYATRGSGQHWVTNSDHHSHSWLTPNEFELAIAAYLKDAGFNIGSLRLEGPQSMTGIVTTKGVADEAKWALNGIAEYWAILAALRCFEAQGHEARLVFWFDN